MWFHVAKCAPFFLVSSMASCVRAEHADSNANRPTATIAIRTPFRIRVPSFQGSVVKIAVNETIRWLVSYLGSARGVKDSLYVTADMCGFFGIGRQPLSEAR